MYDVQMYDVQMYDVRRMYDLPLRGISDLRGGQSSIQENAHPKGCVFSSFVHKLSILHCSFLHKLSILHCSFLHKFYILHSSFLHKFYILHCSFVHFFGAFSLFICIYAKKSVPLHKICNQTYERNQYKETFGDHY